MPDRELRRSKLENARGRLELERVERLGPEERALVREAWWRERRYHVVTPGSELIEAALAPFPNAVRELGRRAPFRRYDDRGGGGFWPDPNRVARAGRRSRRRPQARSRLIAPGISSRTS